MNRRTLLAAIPALALAACSQQQQDDALAKIKTISQSFTDTVTKYGAALFPSVVTQVQANNTAIQALTSGDWIGAARVLVTGTMKLLLPILPALAAVIPVSITGPFQMVLQFLQGFSGVMTAGAMPGGRRVPSMDEAHGAALALRGG